MTFSMGASLLDAVVLSVVQKEGADGSYGYKITQDVRSVMDVSESTLCFRKMSVLKPMTRLFRDETDATIK